MTKTIDFGKREDENDPRFLHIPDAEALGRTINAMLDAMEAQIRADNGGDQERPLCGGCVMNVITQLPKMMLRRGDVSWGEAEGVSRLLLESAFEYLGSASSGIVEEGAYGKVYDAEDHELILVDGRKEKAA